MYILLLCIYTLVRLFKSIIFIEKLSDQQNFNGHCQVFNNF